MTARPVDEYTEIRELASKVAREVYGPIAEQLDVERKPISREERIRLGELDSSASPTRSVTAVPEPRWPRRWR